MFRPSAVGRTAHTGGIQTRHCHPNSPPRVHRFWARLVPSDAPPHLDSSKSCQSPPKQSIFRTSCQKGVPWTLGGMASPTSGVHSDADPAYSSRRRNLPSDAPFASRWKTTPGVKLLKKKLPSLARPPRSDCEPARWSRSPGEYPPSRSGESGQRHRRPTAHRSCRWRFRKFRHSDWWGVSEPLPATLATAIGRSPSSTCCAEAGVARGSFGEQRSPRRCMSMLARSRVEIRLRGERANYKSRPPSVAGDVALLNNRVVAIPWSENEGERLGGSSPRYVPVSPSGERWTKCSRRRLAQWRFGPPPACA